MAITPDKAHAPLLVDTYAVLALAVTLERFQAISRRYAQIVQRCCDTQTQQAHPRWQGNGCEAFDLAIVKQLLRVFTLEITYHTTP